MTTGDWRAAVFFAALMVVVAFFFLGYRCGVLNERDRWRFLAKAKDPAHGPYQPSRLFPSVAEVAR